MQKRKLDLTNRIRVYIRYPDTRHKTGHAAIYLDGEWYSFYPDPGYTLVLRYKGSLLRPKDQESIQPHELYLWQEGEQGQEHLFYSACRANGALVQSVELTADRLGRNTWNEILAVLAIRDKELNPRQKRAIFQAIAGDGFFPARGVSLFHPQTPGFYNSMEKDSIPESASQPDKKKIILERSLGNPEDYDYVRSFLARDVTSLATPLDQRAIAILKMLSSLRQDVESDEDDELTERLRRGLEPGMLEQTFNGRLTRVVENIKAFASDQYQVFDLFSLNKARMKAFLAHWNLIPPQQNINYCLCGRCFTDVCYGDDDERCIPKNHNCSTLVYKALREGGIDKLINKTWSRSNIVIFLASLLFGLVFGILAGVLDTIKISFVKDAPALDDALGGTLVGLTIFALVFSALKIIYYIFSKLYECGAHTFPCGILCMKQCEPVRACCPSPALPYDLAFILREAIIAEQVLYALPRTDEPNSPYRFFRSEPRPQGNPEGPVNASARDVGRVVPEQPPLSAIVVERPGLLRSA